jgi:glycosyltransferase involved in cell wall biosynthesis
MTLFVLDPGLESIAGHHFGYDLLVSAFCKDHGLGCLVFSSKKMRPEIGEAIPAVRLFRASPYVESGDPLDSSLPNASLEDRIKYWKQIFLEDLENLNAHEITRTDVILVHSFRHIQLQAIGEWFRCRFTDNGPRLVLLHTIDSLWDYGGCCLLPNATFYGNALKLFEPLEPDDFTLGAANEMLCRELQLVTNIPSSVHPMPCSRPNSVAFAAPLAGLGSICISSLGASRPEKGFHLLPEVVSQAVEADPRISFLIQISQIVADRDRVVVDRLANLAESTPKLKLVCQDLTLQEHLCHIKSSAIVLLPYDPNRYYARGSNILGEALMLGIPVVVPAGSSLERDYNRYGTGGAVFDRYSPASIVRAILYAANTLNQQLGSSRIASDIWHSKNGIDKFMRYVLGSRF